MPKGKKFDAAEKHFTGKIEELQKRNKLLLHTLVEHEKASVEVAVECVRLAEENAQLREEVSKLLKYSNLSKEQIRCACEMDANIATLVGLTSSVRGILNFR